MTDTQLFFLAAALVPVALGLVLGWGAWRFRGDIF